MEYGTQGSTMTQEVVRLVLTNEIDPWAFVRLFTSLHPLAVVGLLATASLGWVLPKWRHGVFVAAVVAPLSLLAHPFPPWYLPLGAIATFNAAHFAVLLSAYSVAFGLKRLLHRRVA
jgi:hypothetical protein